MITGVTFCLQHKCYGISDALKFYMVWTIAIVTSSLANTTNGVNRKSSVFDHYNWRRCFNVQISLNRQSVVWFYGFYGGLTHSSPPSLSPIWKTSPTKSTRALHLIMSRCMFLLICFSEKHLLCVVKRVFCVWSQHTGPLFSVLFFPNLFLIHASQRVHNKVHFFCSQSPIIYPSNRLWLAVITF